MPLPRGLYHPVLPYRCHNKLTFPLYWACAEALNQTSECTHSDNDRQLSGVWVSFELQKAVEKGYQILHIDEVWHFPNKAEIVGQDISKSMRLLVIPVMSKHLRKRRYIDNYLKKEGIKLEAVKIWINKAVSICNKLLLFLLWGRFSMTNNLPSRELITESHRFTQLMSSYGYDVCNTDCIILTSQLGEWNHPLGVWVGVWEGLY